MRWKSRQRKPDPKPGDTRVVKRFLLLPLTLCGETRWLEWAWVKQECAYRDVCVPGYERVINVLDWVDAEWWDDQQVAIMVAPPVLAEAYRIHRKSKVGGVNEKPEGPRPEPPPAPPTTAINIEFTQEEKDHLEALRRWAIRSRGTKVILGVPLRAPTGPTTFTMATPNVMFGNPWPTDLGRFEFKPKQESK